MTLSAGEVAALPRVRNQGRGPGRPDRKRRTIAGDPRVWLYTIPSCWCSCSCSSGLWCTRCGLALHETTYYEIGEFSGLNSFVALFSDPSLPAQIGTTLVFSLGALVVALPAGLISAIVAQRPSPLQADGAKPVPAAMADVAGNRRHHLAVVPEPQLRSRLLHHHVTGVGAY